MTEQRIRVTTYVSDDGKVFTDRDACMQWEKEVAQRDAQDDFLENVLTNYSAEGFIPVDGKEHRDYYSYTWVMPCSKKEIASWNRTVDDEYARIPEDGIGKWFCIGRDSYEGIQVSSLENCIAYGKSVLRMFGLDMSVEPATRFSYEELLNAQERLKIDDAQFGDVIDIVKKYDHASCSDIDDVIDWYEDDLGY